MNQPRRGAGRRRIPPPLLCGVTVLLLTGCTQPSGGGDAETDAGGTTTSAAPDAPADGNAGCLDPEDECLGELDAGSYTTADFTPSFTYAVPDGWVASEDHETSYLLQAPGTTADDIFSGSGSYVWFLSSAMPAAEVCEPTPEEGVDLTPEAVVEYLQGREDVEFVADPQPVEVGGLTGLSFELEQPEGAGLDCEGLRWSGVLMGQAGEIPTSYGPLTGAFSRYYVLQHGDALLALGIDHAGPDDDPLVADGQGVIDSVEFAI
jgi:hypothetical protein